MPVAADDGASLTVVVVVVGIANGLDTAVCTPATSAKLCSSSIVQESGICANAVCTYVSESRL